MHVSRRPIGAIAGINPETPFWRSTLSNPAGQLAGQLN